MATVEELAEYLFNKQNEGKEEGTYVLYVDNDPGSNQAVINFLSPLFDAYDITLKA